MALFMGKMVLTDIALFSNQRRTTVRAIVFLITVCIIYVNTIIIKIACK